MYNKYKQKTSHYKDSIRRSKGLKEKGIHFIDSGKSGGMDGAKLDRILGIMNSSGGGKWTAETALDLHAVAPVITLAQIRRYHSLENDTFSGKVVATLRNEFGGHAVTEK